MHKLGAALIALAYVGTVLFATPYIGPEWAPWALAVLSLAFVIVFSLVANGNPRLAVSLVVLLTLVFPATVLLAIAWPNYSSVSGLLSSFVSTLAQHGQFLGLEHLLPFVTAALGAYVVSRMRANSTPHADARDLPPPAKAAGARAGGRER